MRVLLVWEDTYFETLVPFVKRRVRELRPGSAAFYPETISVTAKANTKFAHFVRETWPRVRATGMPNQGKPRSIDHVVCVVDADKLADLSLEIPSPPREHSALESWQLAAETTWTDYLRSCSEKAPPSTVHGALLLWNKESLLLAGFDTPCFGDTLSIDQSSRECEEFLAKCSPKPKELVESRASEFSSHFRNPLKCLTDLHRVTNAKERTLAKNAVEIEDTLRTLATTDSALIAERVPSIDAIAKLIWSLAEPAP